MSWFAAATRITARCIELTDQPGFGKGKFDDAVAYARELPDRIVAAILEADGNLPAGEDRRGLARSRT